MSRVFLELSWTPGASYPGYVTLMKDSEGDLGRLYYILEIHHEVPHALYDTYL